MRKANTYNTIYLELLYHYNHVLNTLHKLKCCFLNYSPFISLHALILSGFFQRYFVSNIKLFTFNFKLKIKSKMFIINSMGLSISNSLLKF